MLKMYEHVRTDKWDNILVPQTVDDADLIKEVFIALVHKFPRELLDRNPHGGLSRPRTSSRKCASVDSSISTSP